MERVSATVVDGRLDPPVTVVLEGRFREAAEESDLDGVAVGACAGEGDDTIVAIARSNCDVVVVTADRDLAARVRAVDGVVVGPTWLLDQLEDGSG